MFAIIRVLNHRKMVVVLDWYNETLFYGFIFVLSTVYSVYAEAEISVNLSLKHYNDRNNINGRAFFKYAELHPSDPTIIHIVNVSSDVAFVIVQVHALKRNFTLFMFNTTHEAATFGSNVGVCLTRR